MDFLNQLIDNCQVPVITAFLLGLLTATALPVLVVAWILAYSMQSLGKVMGRIAVFQKWFNRVIAILFIGVGIYYSITMFA